MKRLHCCCDDKFIKGMISLFEADKTEDNDYVVFSNNNALKYVDNKDVTIVSPNHFLKVCLNYDVVFIHFLKQFYYDLIPLIPQRIKVVWFGWGADMYDGDNALVKSMYWGTLTGKYIQKNKRSLIKTIGRRIKFILKIKRNREKTLKRIDYYSGVFPYEYDLIKKTYDGFGAKPLDFYYGSTSFFIPEKPTEERESLIRNNVIIGNSAAYTNNHLDALIALKNSGWIPNGGKVIVPLSYGGDKKYINEIVKLGQELFEDVFEPLIDFLPLATYQEIVSSCKAAIFFHKRQQASDNVFMQLMNGARVFMSKDNPMFEYLRSQGYIVFSLENDAGLINIPMSNEEIFANRKLLSDNYSSSRLVQRVRVINQMLREG